MKCPFCGSDRGYYRSKEYIELCCLILTVNRSGKKMLQIMQDTQETVYRLSQDTSKKTV